MLYTLNTYKINCPTLILSRLHEYTLIHNGCSLSFSLVPMLLQKTVTSLSYNQSINAAINV